MQLIILGRRNGKKLSHLQEQSKEKGKGEGRGSQQDRREKAEILSQNQGGGYREGGARKKKAPEGRKDLQGEGENDIW